MPALRVATEKNAATITTSATGAGTFTATVLQQVQAAILEETNGYVLKVTSISGQVIAFQVKESAGSAAPLANPGSAVSFDPDAITLTEFGY